MNNEQPFPITQNQPYSRLDLAFAQFLTQRSDLNAEQNLRFSSLITQLSFEQNQGHSCIKLNEADQELILNSGLAIEVDLSEQTLPTSKPLILQNHCLYTHRYWFYETRLASQLPALLRQNYVVNSLQTELDRYFPPMTEFDWQRAAAELALSKGLAIISGGPGTGKTTTVVKILALLQEFSAHTPQHIALAAPTGKAAMRLQESIGIQINSLNCNVQIKQQIPTAVSTIHRLLGARPPSPYFRHDNANPLPYDVVVIDEASMVDLALMSKLVDALKPNARLILLGDKDQLASVESGSVLADLTMALPDYTVELKKSHRFQGDVKKLAEFINNQQQESAWQLLTEHRQQVSLLNQDFIDYAATRYSAYLDLLQQQADFADVFAAFTQFEILCSNRQGINGVQEVNQRLEKVLAERKKIKLSGHWYHGKPVMITENHPLTGLYNGDIGICVTDKSLSGRLMVFFLCADSSIKKILPARLPACETAFAMTIHKSQGSEFDEVLIVLADKINPVLTKELLYTAITRAKVSLKIIAQPTVFSAAVQQKVNRYGGLKAKILAAK